MTAGTTAPDRAAAAAPRERFWRLVHAEWTKFRTVRGWVLALLAAVAVPAAFVFAVSGGSSSCSGPGAPAACPGPVTGPGGEPVNDAFYFVHQPLTGNGTITVQVTSLTGQSQSGPGQLTPGLAPWSKAGIIVKASLRQGSGYAAMLVTGAHGVRMQWDYTGDTPGLAGRVSAAAPRWLRLVRHGGTVTGYDSADGTHWIQVGAVRLPGLTRTVQAGLFAAGTGSENPTEATGRFSHIRLSWPATRWTGTNVGGLNGANSASGPGRYQRSAQAMTVTGYGDISPQVPPDGAVTVARALTGTALGLIALIVVAAMFVTVEYRRGLIGVSLTASPRRGRLLAAKAVVIGATGFGTGLAAAIGCLVIGAHTLGGQQLWPVPALTMVWLAVGTGALFAVAGVLALAIGTIGRRSAAAVAGGIVVIFLPYLLAVFPPLQPGPGGSLMGGGLPLGVREWLLRITPAAGFAVHQAVPRFTQVTGVFYLPQSGYFPLPAWAGLAVECGWAAAALALAVVLLRRRDV